MRLDSGVAPRCPWARPRARRALEPPETRSRGTAGGPPHASCFAMAFLQRPEQQRHATQRVRRHGDRPFAQSDAAGLYELQHLEVRSIMQGLEPGELRRRRDRGQERWPDLAGAHGDVKLSVTSDAGPGLTAQGPRLAAGDGGSSRVPCRGSARTAAGAPRPPSYAGGSGRCPLPATSRPVRRRAGRSGGRRRAGAGAGRHSRELER